MPTLYSAGISVHLASQPLAPSLTDKVALKKGYTAAHQTETAEKALRESVHTPLHEDRVPFPGDQGNFALNWLAGAPFLQAVVGNPSERSQRLTDLKHRLALGSDYAALEGSRRSSLGISTRSGRMLPSGDAESEENTSVEGGPTSGSTVGPSPYGVLKDNHQEPKALILHVMLDDKTFFYNPFDNSPQHLKIDVFFNGQLSSCVLLHTLDVRSGAKSLGQIFAGTRIDYQAERPWVIHLPTRADETSLSVTKSASAQDRWVEICKALMNEANERGTGGNGERPPTAAYLQELASMQMPLSVHDWQRPGGRKFGVIDVIVTVGTGKKVTNGVSYLKAPTRLPDERYGYEVNEGSDFDLIKVGPCATATGASAIDADEQGSFGDERDAEGDSDSEYFESMAGASLPLPNQRLSLPPPPSKVHFQNPCTGDRIPPLPSLQPPTSFVGQCLSQPEISTTVPDASQSNEPPKKRGRFEDAAPAIQHDQHVKASRQMPPPRRSYPSAHAPSFSSSSSYGPSIPRAGFNVNQYDSFEHANPYQLPYAGMMAGLSFSSLDGSASSPLRDASGGQLTLPPFIPAPEEVTPSTATTSAFGSSPYQQPIAPPSQPFRVPLLPAGRLPDSSAVPPTATPTGLGISGANSFSPTGYVLSSSPHPQMGAASFHSRSYTNPYMLPPRGPPPPVGLFTVTEKPKAEPPIDPNLLARKPSAAGIVVRRLVVYLGGTLLLDRKFKIPRCLPSKAGAEDKTLSHDLSSVKGRKECLGSSEWVEQIVGRRRQSRTTVALATPPATSPNVAVDQDQDQDQDQERDTGTENMKRDSIHDVLINSELAKSVETVSAPLPRVTGSTPTRASSRKDTYVLCHPTASTGILGVQGPKANVFVFDNPEELLRKKKKVQLQSRSILLTKVDTPPQEMIAGPVEATQPRKVDEPIRSGEVDTRSSSPLSELSHSPQLSFTLEAPTETNQNVKIDLPTLPAPAIPATPAASLPPRSSARLSTTTTTLPAPPPLQQLPVPILAPATLKRKRAYKTPSQGGGVKQPRSPDRLHAKDNPLLNRDCVIQYAVSEREGGALRQVRSERRGVFNEDSVIMGCRFFVAGC